jgi:hypothetical protein
MKLKEDSSLPRQSADQLRMTDIYVFEEGGWLEALPPTTLLYLCDTLNDCNSERSEESHNQSWLEVI